MQQIVILGAVASLLKLLFVPMYRSTDFEVHRNWLAVTHNLSYQKWYYENTSEWTLDYPPFFAWFEYGLSQVAEYFDNQMVNIQNLNHATQMTVLFQKLSVIISDFILIFAISRCCKCLPSSRLPATNLQSRSQPVVLAVLIIFNAGLLLVDHIHFQYNGFLTGMLFLSLHYILEGQFLWGAFWFSTLLNFKHIYLYIAPAYGIFLFRNYCMDSRKKRLDAFRSFNPLRLLELATIVIGVFAASFGPFWNHLPQVLSRLFPFKRGLTHAYWAPNFWALYNFADKVLTTAGIKLKYLDPGNVTTSFSKGLVEVADHSLLPSVTPLATMVITIIFIMPCLLDLWFWPRALSLKHVGNQFLRSIVFVSLTSFMFGWHVHEKAILMAILPAALLAIRGARKDAEIFVFLQAVGHYSLFPLLFQPFETVTKISIVTTYSAFSFELLRSLEQSNLQMKTSWRYPLLGPFESLYIYGLVLCEVYCMVHRFLPFGDQLEFLPLMLTSTYCAIGVSWAWIKLCHLIYSDDSGYPVEWKEPRRYEKITPKAKKGEKLR